MARKANFPGFKRAWLSILLTAAGLFGPSLAQGAPVCQAPALPADAPLCPATTRLLDERYPVSAVSVSDDSGGYAFVERVVDEVLRAQAAPPIFLLNVKDDTFAKIQQHLAARADVQLRQVKASGQDEMGEEQPVYLNWQQDFVKGFFDPRTGAAQPRFIGNYPGVGNLVEQTTKEFAACGIAAGAPTAATEARNGFSGGNFESVGGVCVVGDGDLKPAQWAQYAKDVCGSEPVVKAPTVDMVAHHLDEIFKMIPTGNGGCDFEIGIASVRKAIEILGRRLNDHTFLLPPKSPNESGNARLRGFEIACDAWAAASLRASGHHPQYKEEVEKTDDGRRLLEPHGTSYFSFQETQPYACGGMTNKDLLYAMKNDEVIHEYNTLMQKKLDLFVATLQAALKKLHPTCAIKVHELPQVFVGHIVVERDGSHSLSTEEEDSGYSVFPNPSNSVIVSRTVIFPEPFNQAIRDELANSVTAAGLKPAFIDTLFAHKLEGDLHCSTQVFRACKVK